MYMYMFVCSESTSKVCFQPCAPIQSIEVTLSIPLDTAKLAIHMYMYNNGSCFLGLASRAE